jgi:cobalt/nickel transport system permease protein
MHLPDGILSPTVCATTLLASGATMAFAIKKASTPIASSQAMVLATAAAGILLVQAFNFPVSSIVSGHLLGSALMAWLFGPWVAISLMALVLGLQGSILGDGGIWSFGANLLTLAIVPILVATFARNASTRYGTSRLQTMMAVSISTTVGYLCSALCVAGLLGIGSLGATAWMAGALAQNSLLPAVIEGMVTGTIIAISLCKTSTFTDSSLKTTVSL